jgi:mannosyltransferase
VVKLYFQTEEKIIKKSDMKSLGGANKTSKGVDPCLVQSGNGATARSFEGSHWRQHLQGLLPILGIYLILAFYGIDRQSLWEDEFNSLKRVASSIPIWKDAHGFLYFALLRGWMKLGTSESIVRSLSVAFGASAVCFIYAMGSSLLNRRAALIGTAIFATSPFLIWYSQEARYITLTLASTLLTMCAFQRLILGGRFGWWLAYSSTALLALFSFLSTLFLPIVQGLYLLGAPSRHGFLRKWLICQLVIFILFGWWFVAGTGFWQAFVEAARSTEQTMVNNPKLFPFTGDFNNVRPAVIPYTFFALSAGFSLGPSPRELYADRTLAPLVPYAPMLFGLSALYSGLLLSGLLALRDQRNFGIFLALWIGIPILSVFGIAKLLNIFYDVRYTAMVLPAYVLLLTAGIVRFPRFGVQMILLGAVLAVHALALANYYFDPRYAREDTRSAAQLLESAAKPGDVILVVGTVSSLPYYYKGNLPLVKFSFADGVGQPLTERLRELSADHGRLWLVQIRPWQVDRAGNVKTALDDTYGLIDQQHFPGVHIFCYRISA